VGFSAIFPELLDFATFPVITTWNQTQFTKVIQDSKSPPQRRFQVILLLWDWLWEQLLSLAQCDYPLQASVARHPFEHPTVPDLGTWPPETKQVSHKLAQERL
jgi:hypothetical protein